METPFFWFWLLFVIVVIAWGIVELVSRWSPSQPVIDEESISKVEEKLIDTEEDQAINYQKFSEVMAGLGFKNPLADFLELTKQNKVRWEKTREDVDMGLVVFTAENIIDGIGVTLETVNLCGLLNPLLYHDFYFTDRKKRFGQRDGYFTALGVGKEVLLEDPHDKLVREYWQWLEEKFKPAIYKTPS